jgi:TetR/AcrR family transcriptional regulator, transcriptional repressor of bet genes
MPKLVDHEERRRALASAAVDAISDSGLDDVKLACIARAAGVTTGALAHYFPDKDAILAAALEEVCTRLLTRIGLPDGLPNLAEAASCLPINEERRKEWRVWLAYWGRAPFSEKLRLIHKQYYLDIETALAEELEGYAENPRQVAAALIAAVDGVATRATLEPEAWPPERQRALLGQLLGPLYAEIDRNFAEGRLVPCPA